MDFKYDIFISNAAADRKYCDKMKEAFVNNKLNIFDFDVINSGEDWEEQIAAGITGSEYILILLSPQMARSQSMRNELYFAIMKSKSCGLNIIPVALNEIFESQEQFADFMKANPSLELILFSLQILKGDLNDVVEIVLSTIKKEKRIKQLYKDADQAWVYGAYEQSYHAYIALADLVDGDAVLKCYDRAANCCEKSGRVEEAQKLYVLSKNEKALKRLETVSISTPMGIHAESVDQELLHKIADYCDVSIDLFYELLKKNQSAEGLNCLKTSYSRLLNYCKIIGGMDDVISSALSKMKDIESKFINRETAIESTKSDIVKSYRTYLGLEFPESDNYDVFISYKSEDEILARRVYEYLLSNGKRVFFACEVLPDMGKTEYRDAIMDALDHSQHFVLVASKLDYITSNWVKEEWSFYVSKLIEDNHKGNIAIIVHDDFKVEKNQLPPNLRYKQRLLMSNFKKSLLKYLQQ